MGLELNKIYNMDCLEGLKQLDDNSIDSIVTDPPYELGFMGKKWDNTGIAYNKELWTEALRVLKPGGYLLSFGGTRTYHRMACAIEDAGFEIRDQMQWIYGSGFPKSLNIGKAVDKLQGNEREDLGINPNSRPNQEGKQPITMGGKFIYTNLTKGTSEWEGWGTALKPANEPICVARKPLAEKTVAENVLKWGTGGINIDDCRIGTEIITTNGKGRQDGNTPIVPQSPDFVGECRIGRFPANVLHDGSEEVVSLFPNTKSGKMTNKHTRHTDGSPNGIYGKFDINHELGETYGDSGSAARFFYCAKASKKERNQGLDGFEEKQYSFDGRTKEIENPYQRNKSVAKNNHPTVKPLKLIQYLVRLVTPKGGCVLDPFMGSGTTGMAAKGQGFNYIGFDMTDEYVKIAEARIDSVEIQTKLVE